MPSSRLSLAVTAAVAVVVGMILAAVMVLQKPGNNSGVLGSLTTGKALIGGPFELVDHNGRTVTDATFRGRYMLVYFGFTHCPDICPSSLQVVATALDTLPAETSAKIVPLLITVDPERDTPELLKSYVASFGDRFIGLTGSPEAIARATKAYRVYAKKVGDGGSSQSYTVDHSSFIYLMGPDGAFVTHFNHGVEPDALARRLSELL